MMGAQLLKRATARIGLALSLSLAAASIVLLPRTAAAGDVPTFAVDPAWPKQLPNNWIIGQIGGITVDSQGHLGDPAAALAQRRRKICDAESAARPVLRSRAARP